MKAIKLISTVIVITALIATPMAAMAGKGKGKANANPAAATCSVCVATPLSKEQIKELKWMREEEKLARDIYAAMATQYTNNIFKNIAASEQKHFDAIGEKIVLYGIEDPALGTAPGSFTEPELQALYDELFDKGWMTYKDALEVGVIIEEQDIEDIEAALVGLTSKPLILTYKHLLNGSESHLAAFTKLLDRL